MKFSYFIIINLEKKDYSNNHVKERSSYSFASDFFARRYVGEK